MCGGLSCIKLSEHSLLRALHSSHRESLIIPRLSQAHLRPGTPTLLALWNGLSSEAPAVHSL